MERIGACNTCTVDLKTEKTMLTRLEAFEILRPFEVNADRIARSLFGSQYLYLHNQTNGNTSDAFLQFSGYHLHNYQIPNGRLFSLCHWIYAHFLMTEVALE